MRIIPACIPQNQPQTDLSNLRIIVSPCGVFDPELKQRKFVKESQEENKYPISMRGSVH